MFPAGGTSGSPAGSRRPGFLENLEQVLQMGQEQSGIRDLEDFEEDLPEEEPSFAFKAEDPSLAREAEEPSASAGDTFTDLRNRPGIMEEYERIMKRGMEESTELYSAEGTRSTGALEVIELDEYPFLAQGQRLEFQRNMIVALEPKLIFPGVGVVGIENTHVVTTDGLRQLGKFNEEVNIV